MDELTINRFWARISKQDNECWVWTGSKRNKGYGAFVYNRNGKVIQGRAHRFSYEIHKGSIPEGLMVLHTCDNPSCCNPSHLFIGDNQTNVDDMMRKGRHKPGGTLTPIGQAKYRRGVDHPNVKLNPSIVQAIRHDKSIGVSYSKLSLMYGIAVGHLHRIVSRKAWKCIE